MDVKRTGPRVSTTTVYDCYGCQHLGHEPSGKKGEMPKASANMFRCEEPTLVAKHNVPQVIGHHTRSPGWCPYIKEES